MLDAAGEAGGNKAGAVGADGFAANDFDVITRRRATDACVKIFHPGNILIRV